MRRLNFRRYIMRFVARKSTYEALYKPSALTHNALNYSASQAEHILAAPSA
jgi:hypothetical protein